MTVIEGVVQHGRELGRRLGFPTANLPVDDGAKAEDGVYEARVRIGDRSYRAMANLGCNPSVGTVARRLETHIFDFEGVLYGKRIRVELLRKIRGECKFASIEELRAQIERDKACILRLPDR